MRKIIDGGNESPLLTTGNKLFIIVAIIGIAGLIILEAIIGPTWGY